jgi:hypothetical protein
MYRLAWLFTLATLLQFCKGGHTSSEFDNLIHPSSQHRRGLIQGAAVIGSDVSTIPEQDKWPYTLALARCTQNSTSNSTDLRVVCGASLIHPYVALTAGNRTILVFQLYTSTNDDPILSSFLLLQHIASKAPSM